MVIYAISTLIIAFFCILIVLSERVGQFNAPFQGKAQNSLEAAANKLH